MTLALIEVSGVRKSCVMESSERGFQSLAFPHRFRFAEFFYGARPFDRDRHHGPQSFEGFP